MRIYTIVQTSSRLKRFDLCNRAYAKPCNVAYLEAVDRPSRDATSCAELVAMADITTSI